MKNTTVKSDEEQMRQVFLNLVNNACEAMRGSGLLTITAGKLGDGSLAPELLQCGQGLGGHY